jgi:hypothetical protein
VSKRVCQDGTWVCPIGTVERKECAGTGDCPFSEGGACTDGATGVIYYKQCENGSWSCPGGTHPVGWPAADARPSDAASDGETAAPAEDGGVCGDAAVACPPDASAD